MWIILEFLDGFKASRIKWPIVFVVDTFDSMTGERLAQLNVALQEINGMLEFLTDQNEVSVINSSYWI